MAQFPPNPNASFATPPMSLLPHRGTLILVLGILGLIICQPIGIAAWLMGNTDLRAMREGRMDPSGESLTTAGKVCGIIASVLLGFGLVLGCAYFLIAIVIVGAAAATGPHP